MARVSKYEGGSKSKSFRLPAKRFEEARAAIDAYLQRFEKNNADKPLVFDVTGSIWPGINNPKEKLIFRTNGEQRFPGEPEKRIPGTLKKKGLGKGKQMVSKWGSNLTDPLVYPEFDPASGEGGILPLHSLMIIDEMGHWQKSIPKETIEKLKELDPNIIIPGDKKNKI